MNIIRINKAELLKKLLVNRIRHEKTHQEAMAGFYKKQLQTMTRWLGIAQKNKTVTITSLTVPQNFLDEYDRAIAILRQSVDSVIELTEDDFTHYALDQWEWRGRFVSTSNFYLNKKLT